MIALSTMHYAAGWMGATEGTTPLCTTIIPPGNRQRRAPVLRRSIPANGLGLPMGSLPPDDWRPTVPWPL